LFALFALFLPALPAVDAEKIDNRDFAIDTCFPTPNEIQLAEGRTRVFFTGIIAGMILFSIIRALRGRYAYSLGLALEIAMGVPAALISHRVG
jgi:hypothetical protein